MKGSIWDSWQDQLEAQNVRIQKQAPYKMVLMFIVKLLLASLLKPEGRVCSQHISESASRFI